MALHVTIEHSFRGFSLSVDFTAPEQGVTVLFGPSGAGKSTVLAAVAGFLRADVAQVELNGEALHRRSPERRRFGMVFQDGLLFPHMSVRNNLLYGMRRARRRRIPVIDVVSLLGLEALLDRRPRTLSGGERQRVAIGRALLRQPRLLLMDEPLASLDMARRLEILPYLARLRDQLRLPMLYVTHSLDEAVRLADHMVLMDNGRVVASGAMAELAARVDLPLAARLDAMGVLNGYLHSHDEERRLSAVACGGQVYLVPLAEHIAPRTSVRLLVPAREVVLSLDVPRAVSVSNVIPATVCNVGQDKPGHAALVELDVGGGLLLSRVTMDAAERLYLRPGTRVLALIKSMSVELLA